MFFHCLQVGGGSGGSGGGAGNLGGPIHHSGSGSGSHTPMDIDEGIEIPAEKVKNFKSEFKRNSGAKGWIIMSIRIG